jgi:hypothetical protein
MSSIKSVIYLFLLYQSAREIRFHVVLQGNIWTFYLAEVLCGLHERTWRLEIIYRLKQRAWKLWVPIPGVCFMFWIWLVILLMYYEGKQWFNIVLSGNTFLCFQSGDVRCKNIQGDQNVSVHLMITVQKVTSNVQSVLRQSPDIYWHAELCSRILCSRRPCSV